GDFGESLLALANLLPHGKGELGILARKLAGTPMTVAMRMVPSSWGFLTGMARRRTESMSWKMAVLAPMPSARVRTEMMVKPGLRRRRRKAWRRLCQNEAILTPSGV